ncbi:MAG: DUF6504 family protein [Ignavibacteriales bacterium]
MSKIVNQPVLVLADKQMRPSRFFWFNRWFYVSRLMDVWNEAGQWWEGEPEKTVYRVLCNRDTMFELEFRGAERQWVLYKVYD